MKVRGNDWVSLVLSETITATQASCLDDKIIFEKDMFTRLTDILKKLEGTSATTDKKDKYCTSFFKATCSRGPRYA